MFQTNRLEFWSFLFSTPLPCFYASSHKTILSVLRTPSPYPPFLPFFSSSYANPRAPYPGLSTTKLKPRFFCMHASYTDQNVCGYRTHTHHQQLTNLNQTRMKKLNHFSMFVTILRLSKFIKTFYIYCVDIIYLWKFSFREFRNRLYPICVILKIPFFRFLEYNFYKNKTNNIVVRVMYQTNFMCHNYLQNNKKKKLQDLFLI